jgi:hypothetical protein
MTDYWPSEEGAIVEGGLVVNCYCDNAITEGAIVKFGTTGANKIAVDANAAAGTGVGVALKAGAQYDIIPVMFHGIVKIVLNETLTIGQPVQASATSNQVIGTEEATSVLLRINAAAGTCYILGHLLQGGNADDEVLMLVNPL